MEVLYSPTHSQPLSIHSLTNRLLEPFTNFDLAKLLKLNKGEKKNVVIATEDVLSGDCERADVAELIALIITNFNKLTFKSNKFSLINVDGGEPDWGSILKSL